MIVHQLVEKAKRKAQGAQATVRQNEASNVLFENNRLKSTQSSQRTEVEVKVVVNGLLGRSSTTAVDDLDGVVQRALEAAEFGSPARFQFPGPEAGSQVKTYDPALLPLSKSEMIRTGQEMVDLIQAYNPEVQASARVNRSISRVEFANSAGATFVEESTDYGVVAYGDLVRGTDILSAGHGLGRRKREIDHAAVARRAIEWLRLAERIVPVESGDMPVVFTPEGLIVLMLSLIMGLDGKNVFLGESPLAGKLGQTVVDPRFSLIDDPLVDYAAHSSAYDGEGLPRRVTPLIQDGVLRSFMYDLDTAARAGVQPTGHGPDRQTTNVLIRAGDTPYEEMIRGIGKGLLVHDVMGLGLGNPISGEFSVNVQLGYKIENGEITGRVKDVMLAGNAYDALKDIAAISDRAEWVSGWLTGLIPYVQIGKLSVVAR